MDAQGAPQAGDALQLALELGVPGDHLGKLIDDDEQERVRRRVRTGVQPFLAVMHDILGIGVGVQALAAVELGDDGGEHARRGRAFQVGDDIHAVRQGAEGLEGRPALVIHQDEVHHARVEVQAQPDDQAHEQLGFARARAARDQPVNAVALGREDQLARLVARQQADLGVQPVRAGGFHAALPVLVDHRQHLVQGGDAQHVEQRDARREVGPIAHAHHQGLDRFGKIAAQLLAADEVGRTDVARRVQADLGVAENRLAALLQLDVGLDHRLAGAGHLAPVGDEEDDGRAQALAFLQDQGDCRLRFQVAQGRPLGQLAEHVHHDQHEGQGHVCAAALFIHQAHPAALQDGADVLPEQGDPVLLFIALLLRLVFKAQALGMPALLGMRQGECPAPVLARLIPADHVEMRVGRGVVGGEIDQQRADVVVYPARVIAGDADRVAGDLLDSPFRLAAGRALDRAVLFRGRPEGNGYRDVLHIARILRQADRVADGRVSPVLLRAELVDHAGGQRAAPQPDPAEIIIGRPALPQARPRADILHPAARLPAQVGCHAQGHLRIRIVVVVENPLDLVRIFHLLAQLDQPLAVGPLRVLVLFPRLPVGINRQEKGPDHGHTHGDEHDQAAALPENRDEYRPEDGEGRHRHLGDKLVGGLLFLRGSWDLVDARRQLWLDTGWAVDIILSAQGVTLPGKGMDIAFTGSPPPERAAARSPWLPR